MEVNVDNFIIDGINFFNQPTDNDLKAYGIIKKITTGQSDDCTTGCLLDYPHFKKLYELIATDLRK